MGIGPPQIEAQQSHLLSVASLRLLAHACDSLACAGTHIHRAGGQAFLRARAREPAQGMKQGDLAALQEAVRVRGRVHQQQCKREAEEDAMLRKKLLDEAKARVEPFFQSSNVLQGIENCEFRAMRHSCPALVPVTTASMALQAAKHAAEPLGTLAQAWKTQHLGVEAGPKQKLDTFWKPAVLPAWLLQLWSETGSSAPVLERAAELPSRELGRRRHENLAHGHVVICWRSLSVLPEENSASHLLFTAVPLMHLRPYRPTLLEMHHLSKVLPESPLVTEEADTLRALLHGEDTHGFISLGVVEKQGIPSCAGPRACLKQLDLERQWGVRILLWSQRRSVWSSSSRQRTPMSSLRLTPQSSLSRWNPAA